MIRAPDSDLFHIGIRGVEEVPLLGEGDHGQRVRPALRGQRRTFQRIERDVDLGALAGADFLADVEHRGLVPLALADDDGAIDIEQVERRAHGIDSGLVGGLFIAKTNKVTGGARRGFRYTDNFQCEISI